MQNNNFSCYRVAQLLKSDIRNNFKRDLLILGGLIAVSSFFFFVVLNDSSMFYGEPERMPREVIPYAKFHITYFPILLLMSGFIYTSLTFRELGKKTSRQFYFGLPASTFEKWLSKWLSTAILFPVACLLTYQLFAQVTYLSMLSKGYTMVRLPIIDYWVWLWIGVYILSQSVFFLGAVSFPKFSLIKSVLVLAVSALLIRFTYMTSVDTLLPLFSERAMGFSEAGRWSLNESLFLDIRLVADSFDQLPGLLVTIFMLGLASLLAFISFLKLKEKEV